MDLEELRKRRAVELQQQMGEQQAEAEASRAYEMQIDQELKKILTPEAKSRLSTLKLANPTLAAQVEKLVIYVAQTQNIPKIDDVILKKILTKISGKKRDITIIRK